jgi:hypothetical protein
VRVTPVTARGLTVERHVTRCAVLATRAQHRCMPVMAWSTISRGILGMALVMCGEAGERLLVAQVYSGTCGVRTEVSFGELTFGMDKSRTGSPRRKVLAEIGVCPLCQPLWARLPSGSGDALRTSCRSSLGLEWESGRNQPWTQPPQPS